MKKFSDLLNENIQQAKAYLRTQNIVPEDDYLFQVIKDRFQGKEGYIGWFTKIAHENIKPNSKNNGEVIGEVEKIMKRIEDNPQIIELLETPITQQDTLEKFQDDYEKAVLKYKAKNIFNKFPRTQKNLIDIKGKDVISLLSKLYDIEDKPFIRKISSYHTKDELLKGLERFLSGDSNTEFDGILDDLENISTPIVYADENRNLIIAKILNSQQCDKIGSRTSWCIVGSESTFNSYVNPSNAGVQYAIYLTDKSFSDDDRLIGATFNINGYNTAHNVTDGYISQENLKKILKDKDFDIKKLMVTKDTLKNQNIDNFNIKTLIRVGFTFDEVMKKKNKYNYQDVLYLKEKDHNIEKYYDKLDYEGLTVNQLEKLFTLEEILKRKSTYTWKDMENFSKEEIIEHDLLNKMSENYYAEHLKSWGFTVEEILNIKKTIRKHELEAFTKEEIEKYNITDKLEIMGNDINNHVNKFGLTKEKFLNQLYRVIPNTLELWHMKDVLKMSNDDIKENIEKLKPLFSDVSKEIYDKYLGKDKIENIHDLQYGSRFKDYKDPDKYDVDKTIFLLNWYDITPEKYSLSELTEILEDVNSWGLEETHKSLKDLGYFKDTSTIDIYNFYKKVCKSHYSSNEYSLFDSVYRLGYDISDIVIGHFLQKDDDGNYKRSSGGYGGVTSPMDEVYGYTSERRNREKIKEILKDHPKALEKIIHYDNINEFYKYTLAVAEHTWNGERDKPSIEKWVEMYGKPNVELNWNDLNGRCRIECLMSYIILMAYTNNTDELYKLNGINWGVGTDRRGVFDETRLQQLSDIIVGTDITNHSATYKLEPKLDSDQRTKLHNWTMDYVYPSIEDKDEYEQDLQLQYLIFDRIALNQLIDKTKKYNVVTKAIGVMTPLFKYLIEPMYNKTFFYEQKRFDRILDLKYYLKLFFSGYEKFTTKEIEKLKYVLIKKPHFTSEVKYLDKSNEIAEEILKPLSNVSDSRGAVIGKRMVKQESKVKNFMDFMFEKVQPDYFEKNPDFYLTKNIEDMKKEKEQGTDHHDNENRDEYIKTIKNIRVEDIPIEYDDEHKQYRMEIGNTNVNVSKYNDGWNFDWLSYETEYNYKLILAVLGIMKENTAMWVNTPKELINPLFKNIDDYYGVYYYNGDERKMYLLLTKSKRDFGSKLKEIKKNPNWKSFYINNKVKGKELTDYNKIKLSHIKNKLKNISYNDIELVQNEHGYGYKFKDGEINNDLLKLGISTSRFFTKDGSMGHSKTYFGHLKNRYHAHSLPEEFKGIGLGYKLYKALLKENGYIVSDEQSSVGARKMYYYLLKDDNVLHVIDKDDKDPKQGNFGKDTQKVLLIWKDHPKIEKLMRIIRKNELKTGRKYKYDKDLLKYIKNVKE